MKLTKYYKNQLFYAFLVKYNVQAWQTRFWLCEA